MANKLNGFLDNVVSGALSPKGNLGDFAHAARLYVDDAHRLSPKHKILYHVSFNLNPKAVAVTPQLKTDKESLSIYFRDGDPLKEFSIMKRPDLANTFRVISKNGIKGFYEGEIADKIVNAMNSNGGLITHEDLKNYKSFFRMPIAINYKGHKVFTAAPPSGGGITLLTALNILNNIDIKKYKSDSTKTYHFLAESLRRGHNNRSHFVGDPDYFDVPITELLSAKRTKELITSIDSNKASSIDQVIPYTTRKESKDTTPKPKGTATTKNKKVVASKRKKKKSKKSSKRKK